MNIMEPQGRESKLPVWAQDLIGFLRRRVTQVEQEKNVLRWSQPGTDTFLDGGLREDYRELPRGAEINFLLGPADRHRISVRLTRDHKGPFLHVSGQRSLIIEPWVTNLIHLRSDD